MIGLGRFLQNGIIVAATFAILFSGSIRQPTDAAELTGRVVDVLGKPVTNAVIYIRYAKPVVGRWFCLTCVAECGRRVRTDDDGRFAFAGVTDGYEFALVVGADGLEGVTSEWIDPSHQKGYFVLPPMRIDNGSHLVRGRILDADDRPIPGATVRVLYTRDAKGRRADILRVTPATVCDPCGWYELRVDRLIDSFGLRCEASGYVATNFVRTNTRSDRITYLSRGCVVRGRVVCDGEPVSGLALVLNSADLSSDDEASFRRTSTDADGRFEIRCLQSRTPVVLSSEVATHRGASLLPKRFQTPPGSAISFLGDLEAVKTTSIKLAASFGNDESRPMRVLLRYQDVLHMTELDWPADQPVLEITGVGAYPMVLDVRGDGIRLEETSPWTQPGGNRVRHLLVERPGTLWLKMVRDLDSASP